MSDKKGDDKEAEGAEGGEAGAEGGAVKGKRKLIIILIIALLLLLGAAGAGLYFSGILGGSEEHAEGEAPAAEGEAPAEGEHGEAPAEGEHGEGAAAPAGPQVAFYDLPEFLVNLNTNGGRTSFLKMKVSLELENAEQTVTIKAYEPKIVDSFNTYLRDLRSTDLSGSAGIHRLREELLLRINKITYPEKVKDVLFKEMIVQ